MKSKEVLSESEKYRQERKERIKKESGKTKKGTGKAAAVFQKVIAIVLCVVIAGGGIWFLADFFGWPQKLTTVATVKVGDKDVKINAAKFNFYYMSAYSSAANTSYQYAQYNYNSGFDYKKSAEEQKTKDDDGNEITYAEKFKNDALASIEQVLYYSNLAKEKNIELTAEDREEIESTIKSMRTTAASSKTPMSLSAYIIRMYGKGLNAKLFEEYLEEQQLASRYLEAVQEDYANGYSDSEIQAVYDKDPNEYKKVDVRVYGFSIAAQKDDEGNEIAPKYSKEEQQARAEEMVSKITDEASFKTLCLEYCEDSEKEDFSKDDASLARGMEYSAIKSNMSEEDAKWAFSADRQAGDTAIWTTSSYIYAVYLVKPAYIPDTNYVSVRHILVKFPDEEKTENTVSEPTTDKDGKEIKAEEPTVLATHLDDGIAYEGKKHDKNANETVYKETINTNKDAERIAKEYYELYNKGEKTEEAFAKLADLYSDDTSSTSAGNGHGGLISNMTVGQYVKPFENWAFDANRKPGDTEIIESEYGYHIMYFVEKKDEPSWKTDIRTSLAKDKVEEESEKAEESYKGSLTSAKSMDRFYKKAVKAAESLYVG